MGHYHYLLTGLPALSLDDAKKTWTVAEFKAEMEPMLSASDKKLVRWIFYIYDNLNLLASLRKKADAEFDDRGVYTAEEITEICHLLYTEDRVPPRIPTPDYVVSFVRNFYIRQEEADNQEMDGLLEDSLSALYYNEAMRCQNEFLSAWFELNLNIRNVMLSVNCRKYGLEKNDYIVGNNDMAEYLRQWGSRDLNFSDAPAYLQELLQISEEPDLLVRERKTDALRWQWLEDRTFYKTFDFESVMAYLLRLEILERWMALDKALGEKTFRRLVTDMKRESANTLEEFKENNK